MLDPRAPNARDHATDQDGKVTGVYVNVHRTPGAKFACQSVRLIDEHEAQGNTIIRVKFTGASGPLFLATGYQGNPDSFDDFLSDSSGRGELTMAGSGAKFWPPNLGPLAVVVRENGKIVSDVIGNLGLPGGHHVSFEVVFAQAGQQTQDNSDMQEGAGGTQMPPFDLEDLAEVASQLEALARRLRGL